ncbi:MAG: hypothetical protein LBG90_03205 [Spirochaetaceae bacterium]|jgi:uncharacterized small protein (DUF1192 family)|nr:hypothetical protein [Spirochaetaceae bacterium]
MIATNNRKKTSAEVYAFPVKEGLLQKANLFKIKQAPKSDPDEKVITNDDLAQIQDQIDEIIHQNRLAVRNTETVATHRASELTLPLAVNGFMIFLAGLIISGIILGVNKEEEENTFQNAGFSSVEGQLIQKMRQEAEYQAAEKEREIEEMRRQLANLANEKNNALAKIETQYKDREIEDRKRLEQDIAAERERLIRSGVAIRQVDELLAVYEKERFAYYQDELAKYKEEIEQERRSAEAKFQALQNSYQKDIKSLSEERQTIQKVLQEREQELRGGPAGSPDPESEKARAALAALEAQRKQTQLEENRITGMFNQLRTALQQERYPSAIAQAESLIQYLENSSPDTNQRRSLDIYLASALAQIARNEQNRNAERSSETNTLRSRITALEEENARLNRLNTELSKTSEQDRQRNSEIEALRARLTQNEAKITELSERIAQLQQENARLTQANQNLTQNAGQTQTNTAALSERITQLQQENARLTQANQSLTQNAGQTQTNAAALSERITQLQQENARLTQANQSLTQNARQTQTLSERIAQLQQENARIAAENAKLAKANENLSKDQEKAASLTNQISDWIVKLEVENTRLTNINRELSQKIQPAPKYGIADVSSILRTSLEMDAESGKKYLETEKTKYAKEPDVLAFIELLITRLY